GRIASRVLIESVTNANAIAFMESLVLSATRVESGVELQTVDLRSLQQVQKSVVGFHSEESHSVNTNARSSTSKESMVLVVSRVPTTKGEYAIAVFDPGRVASVVSAKNVENEQGTQWQVQT